MTQNGLFVAGFGLVAIAYGQGGFEARLETRPLLLGGVPNRTSFESSRRVEPDPGFLRIGDWRMTVQDEAADAG